ncbi:MAG: hypothetical protein AAGA48_10280 [Myxococcota bacterium]
MIGFALWTACTSAPSGPLDPPPIEPLEWDFSTDDTLEPIDLAAVGSALDRAVVDVLTYDARPLIEGYRDRLATSGTPNCPAITVDPAGNQYWVSGCYADDGSVFGGFLFYYPQVDNFDGQFLFTGDSVVGNARIVDPMGDAIDIQGSAVFLRGRAADDSSELVVNSVSGGFGMDADAPRWLDAGPQSANVELVGLQFVGGLGLVVQATGAIVVADDDGTWAASFSANAMALGPLSACDSEPGGVVSVRDPAGRWIDIEFDGPILDESAGDAAACDGCGQARADGAELGLVCADFTPWFSWEALP